MRPRVQDRVLTAKGSLQQGSHFYHLRRGSILSDEIGQTGSPMHDYVLVVLWLRFYKHYRMRVISVP